MDMLCPFYPHLCPFGFQCMFLHDDRLLAPAPLLPGMERERCRWSRSRRFCPRRWFCYDTHRDDPPFHAPPPPLLPFAHAHPFGAPLPFPSAHPFGAPLPFPFPFPLAHPLLPLPFPPAHPFGAPLPVPPAHPVGDPHPFGAPLPVPPAHPVRALPPVPPAHPVGHPHPFGAPLPVPPADPVGAPLLNDWDPVMDGITSEPMGPMDLAASSSRVRSRYIRTD